ncbi:hypothetical protein EDB85DRAFT_2229469 [Lactarius pseudohatsudake]|nr:hypothetical protein EDB85DRAFT_2229469 [Lactarius pseudohatsudake]
MWDWSSLYLVHRASCVTACGPLRYKEPSDDEILDETSKQFLTKRVGDDAGADGVVDPVYHLCSDRARLQNIVRFLTDIKDMLGELNKQWWTSKNAELIRKKRKDLFTTRDAHTEGYRTDHGKFDQQPEGDRASPAFVPAAQLDLITLTLEILARDSVANTAESQREAFRVAYEEFENAAFTQAKEQAKEQRLGKLLEQMRVLSESDQEALNWIENEARDGIETANRALGSVMRSLLPQTNQLQASQIASPPSNSTADGGAPAHRVGLPPSPMEPFSPSYLGPPPSERPLDVESRGPLS